MSERKGEIPIKDMRQSFDTYWATSKGKSSKKYRKIVHI